MRSYSVQIPPGGKTEDAVVLPDGFCWWAVLFGPLWFWWHRLWIGGIGLAVLQGVLTGSLEHLGFGPVQVAVASGGVAILVGFSARDWWRWRLSDKGYRFADVVIATSQREAEWRWFSRIRPAAGAIA
jgi:hypothetical protein